jgi:four helix bundle suffix protein
MENNSNKGNVKFQAGYRSLLAYKLAQAIYDLTPEFIERYLNKYSRNPDQVDQAARSGVQNIAEGYQQQGLKGYIKLAGVSRGSFEEYLNDVLAVARRRKINIWDKEKARREIREIDKIWEIIKANHSLPDSPDWPQLPKSNDKAINLLITLLNQENYLLDKLIYSLKQKHKTDGGLTEKLYKDRKSFRGY